VCARGVDLVRQRGVGRLQVQHDAGEILGQRVVDLPRQALPLRQHAGLVFGLGQALARGFQRFDQLLAPLALHHHRAHPPCE
jgi:hypothetical protein